MALPLLPTSLVGSYAQPEWLIDRAKLAGRFPPRTRQKELWRIPEDMLDKIFYPMVTGRAEGTGLGLTIAQSLIQQHDGLVEVNSVPGRTVFTVLLPI